MSDLTKRLCRPGYDIQKEQAIQEAIIEIRELRARIEAMEKQEPGAIAKWTTGGVAVHLVGDVRPGDKLYLAPGAQPAPIIPEGWKLVPIESTSVMDVAGSDHCDGYRSTAEAVWSAMLAAAPEAKS